MKIFLYKTLFYFLLFLVFKKTTSQISNQQQWYQSNTPTNYGQTPSFPAAMNLQTNNHPTHNADTKSQIPKNSQLNQLILSKILTNPNVKAMMNPNVRSSTNNNVNANANPLNTATVVDTNPNVINNYIIVPKDLFYDEIETKHELAIKRSPSKTSEIQSNSENKPKQLEMMNLEEKKTNVDLNNEYFNQEVERPRRRPHSEHNSTRPKHNQSNQQTNRSTSNQRANHTRQTSKQTKSKNKTRSNTSYAQNGNDKRVQNRHLSNQHKVSEGNKLSTQIKNNENRKGNVTKTSKTKSNAASSLKNNAKRPVNKQNRSMQRNKYTSQSSSSGQNKPEKDPREEFAIREVQRNFPSITKEEAKKLYNQMNQQISRNNPYQVPSLSYPTSFQMPKPKIQNRTKPKTRRRKKQRKNLVTTEKPKTNIADDCIPTLNVTKAVDKNKTLCSDSSLSSLNKKYKIATTQQISRACKESQNEKKQVNSTNTQNKIISELSCENVVKMEEMILDDYYPDFTSNNLAYLMSDEKLDSKNLDDDRYEYSTDRNNKDDSNRKYDESLENHVLFDKKESLKKYQTKKSHIRNKTDDDSFEFEQNEKKQNPLFRTPPALELPDFETKQVDKKSMITKQESEETPGKDKLITHGHSKVVNYGHISDYDSEEYSDENKQSMKKGYDPQSGTVVVLAESLKER